MNQNTAFYQELAQAINRTLKRKAVTVDHIRRIVDEAKWVRRNGGTLELYQFATTLWDRMFSPEEQERLKQSPSRRDFSYRFLDLLVKEQVLTPRQARLMKSTIR